MIVGFGFEKLDNGRVKIHTLYWSNAVQKKAKCLDYPPMRIVSLGVATDKQKEMFYDKESELQTRIPVAEEAWGRGRFPRKAKSKAAVRQEED